MKLGYPCLNRGLGCTSAGTFRLASYSPERVIEVTERNLNCLERMLEFNAKHGLLFFRISANIIPFASHPVMDFDWQGYFRQRLAEIGNYIRAHDMRISIHAHAAVWLAAVKETTYQSSVRELIYNAEVMDLMGLDSTNKVQIHADSFFGDRQATLQRFAQRYAQLPDNLRRRLVAENDERGFGLEDCLELHSLTGIPVLFDTLHHRVFGSTLPYSEAMGLAASTWQKSDGIPMIDFSSQNSGKRIGAHAESIDIGEFTNFITETSGLDYDIMFEIKDKETSALKALGAIKDDPRLIASQSDDLVRPETAEPVIMTDQPVEFVDN